MHDSVIKFTLNNNMHMHEEKAPPGLLLY